MNLQHVNVKLFVDGTSGVAPVRFIDVFHQWIQDHALDELLIDVADYRHVPNGPGVLLIAAEADYSMDHTDGRWGLRYNRKAPLDGTNPQRFAQAFRAAANACRMLENHFANDGGLTFSRRTFELFINDRAIAPNTPETYAACKPDIETFLEQLLGHDAFDLEHDANPRRRFSVTVAVSRPFDFPNLSTT